MENLFSKYRCTLQAVVTIMMADANPATVSRDGQRMRLPVEERETSDTTLFGGGLGGCGRQEAISY